MLNDLLISGFRALKRLEIAKLGRVNLITGRNNSGKSCLLEALRLYASGGSPDVMLDLLQSRDEGPTSSDALSVLNLFHGRRTASEIDQGLKIEIALGPSPLALFTMEMAWWDAPSKSIETKFVAGHAPAINVGFANKRLLILDRPLARDPIESPPKLRAEYVGPNGLSNPEIEYMWDKVALTDLEDSALDAVRIIAPEIEKVSLVAPDQRASRKPFVRVHGAMRPIPLRSLGDGMNRLIGIALAMVNARDGYLLIDEIENGVHYSVQPELWSFIVRLATRLNIHVFATTHSWDCIKAFQEATREPASDGMLIRLQWRNGAVQSVEFTENELAIATRESIEVR